MPLYDKSYWKPKKHSPISLVARRAQTVPKLIQSDKIMYRASPAFRSLLHESCFVLISYPSEGCHIWSSAPYLSQAMWTHNTFPNHLRTFFFRGRSGANCLLCVIACLMPCPYYLVFPSLSLSLLWRRWHGGKFSAYSRIQIRIGIAVCLSTVDNFDVASCFSGVLKLFWLFIWPHFGEGFAEC